MLRIICSAQIPRFTLLLSSFGAADISANILDKNFIVQPVKNTDTEPFVAWFVVLRKPRAGST